MATAVATKGADGDDVGTERPPPLDPPFCSLSSQEVSSSATDKHSVKGRNTGLTRTETERLLQCGIGVVGDIDAVAAVIEDTDIVLPEKGVQIKSEKEEAGKENDAISKAVTVVESTDRYTAGKRDVDEADVGVGAASRPPPKSTSSSKQTPPNQDSSPGGSGSKRRQKQQRRRRPQRERSDAELAALEEIERRRRQQQQQQQQRVRRGGGRGLGDFGGIIARASTAAAMRSGGGGGGAWMDEYPFSTFSQSQWRKFYQHGGESANRFFRDAFGQYMGEEEEGSGGGGRRNAPFEEAWVAFASLALSLARFVRKATIASAALAVVLTMSMLSYAALYAAVMPSHSIRVPVYFDYDFRPERHRTGPYGHYVSRLEEAERIRPAEANRSRRSSSSSSSINSISSMARTEASKEEGATPGADYGTCKGNVGPELTEDCAKKEPPSSLQGSNDVVESGEGGGGDQDDVDADVPSSVVGRRISDASSFPAPDGDAYQDLDPNPHSESNTDTITTRFEAMDGVSSAPGKSGLGKREHGRTLPPTAVLDLLASHAQWTPRIAGAEFSHFRSRGFASRPPGSPVSSALWGIFGLLSYVRGGGKEGSNGGNSAVHNVVGRDHIDKPGKREYIAASHPAHILFPSIRHYVEVVLTLPETDANRLAGIFMVRLDLLSSDGIVLASSDRSAMLPHESAFVSMARRVLLVVPILLGAIPEARTITVRCIDNYVESNEWPLAAATVRLVTPNHPPPRSFYVSPTHVDFAVGDRNGGGGGGNAPPQVLAAELRIGKEPNAAQRLMKERFYTCGAVGTAMFAAWYGTIGLAAFAMWWKRSRGRLGSGGMSRGRSRSRNRRGGAGCDSGGEGGGADGDGSLNSDVEHGWERATDEGGIGDGHGDAPPSSAFHDDRAVVEQSGSFQEGEVEDIDDVDVDLTDDEFEEDYDPGDWEETSAYKDENLDVERNESTKPIAVKGSEGTDARSYPKSNQKSNAVREDDFIGEGTLSHDDSEMRETFPKGEMKTPSKKKN